MIKSGAKFYLGLAGLAVAAAALYGWGSRGGFLGVLSGGVKGSIGERTGFVVLLGAAAVAALLAGIVIAFRDADADAVRAVARVETVPTASPPAGVAWWPVLGAVAVAVAVIGLVVEPLLFIVGCVLAALTMVEWLVQAWADRATGDPVANREIRNRIMYPIEIPVIALIGIFAFVYPISRVLLALPEGGATWVAIAVATLILAGASVIALRPHVSRNLLVGLAVVVAVAVIVGGIIAAAAGEREFEKHDEEHGLSPQTVELVR